MLTQATAKAFIKSIVKEDSRRGMKVLTVATRKGDVEILMTLANYKLLLTVAGAKGLE